MEKKNSVHNFKRQTVQKGKSLGSKIMDDFLSVS